MAALLTSIFGQAQARGPLLMLCIPASSFSGPRPALLLRKATESCLRSPTTRLKPLCAWKIHMKGLRAAENRLQPMPGFVNLTSASSWSRYFTGLSVLPRKSRGKLPRLGALACLFPGIYVVLMPENDTVLGCFAAVGDSPL